MSTFSKVVGVNEALRLHQERRREHERQRLLLVRQGHPRAAAERDAEHAWVPNEIQRPTVDVGWLMAETCRTLALTAKGQQIA